MKFDLGDGATRQRVTHGDEPGVLAAAVERRHVQCALTHLQVTAAVNYLQKVKVKVTWIYTAPERDSPQRRSGMDHTVLPTQHQACLYLVSVHQMAPPLIVITDI